MDTIPEILKDCGRLLALGQSSSNIETQINSDPKAVNLTIALKDDFQLKIVQNLQMALSGKSSVYITDEQEYNLTKKLLEQNECKTDRVIKMVATQITCKFCQIENENQSEYIDHLK